MTFDDIQALADALPRTAGTGPVALIFAEEEVEVEGTILHHLRLGFDRVVLLVPPRFAPARPLPERVIRGGWRIDGADAVPRAINALMPRLAGCWVYWGYNAEYLFYPFCDTRPVGDLLAFHDGERRDAMRTTVVDLYAADSDAYPDGVAPADALFDATGYHMLDRRDPITGTPLERRDEIRGGLRRRFGEYVPPDRADLGRTGLFRAARDLRMGGDFRFSDPEYDTISCPWHRNVTAAVASFRAAKALCTNPASRTVASRLVWEGSAPFDWTADQLIDHGLMEPGQWF